MERSTVPTLGELFAAREQLEVAADRAFLAALTGFRTAAAEAIPPDALTAAAGPALRAAVDAAWTAATLRVIRAAGRILGIPVPASLGDPDPTPLAVRAPGALGVVASVVAGSDFPVAAFDAITAVLALGSREQLTARATRSALYQTLTPHGAMPRPVVDPANPAPAPSLEEYGVSWAARSAALARASATATVAAHALAEYEASPYAMGARWLSMHDARVRPTHARAHGQVQPLGALFVVGGFELRYPGDPRGPLAETAGCRCILGPVYSD